MHWAEADRPVWLEYVPLGQSVGAAEPRGQYWPSGHSTSTSWDEPSGQ